METTELVGTAEILLIDPEGNVKDSEVVHNLITTTGDQYYANRANNVASPATVTGMKLGTGSVAASKSGANSTLGAYIAASNNAFDNAPAVASEGADAGYSVSFQTTWAAGDVTNSAITEAIICNDSATNATSASGVVISRIMFAAKNKTVDDSLIITWKHLFKGA